MSAPIILIITKDAESRGGVANYFRLFFRKFDDPGIRIERADIGSRANQYYKRWNRPFAYLCEFITDVFAIRKRLKMNLSIEVVQVNPSMIPLPLFRDGILVLMAKIYNRKVVVFFRGWDEKMVVRLNGNRPLLSLFCRIYKKADAVILLANEFKLQLLQWGLKAQRLHVSRTMFDGDMIQAPGPKKNPMPRFIFLSRISREKGAFEIVHAASRLKEAGYDFRIAFHGYGATANTVAELAALATKLGVLDRIELCGFVDGQEKYLAYSQADVFLLPSFHPEGCPNSVLEAMASGCFVISSDRGALKEVVQDRINGLMVEPGNAEDLAETMMWTLQNINEVRRKGQENRKYAFELFESKIIVAQIASIYRGLIQGE